MSLPKYNNQYGTPNLYCHFTVINSKETINKIISLSISMNLIDSAFLIEVYIKYVDGTISYLTVNQVEYSISVENIAAMTFHYYSMVSYDEIPFLITIDKPYENNSYILYISIGLVIIACLVFSLGIFFLSRKLAEKRIRQYRIDQSNLEQSLKLKKTKQVENFIQNDLKESVYNPSIHPNESCSICQENYESITIVTMTQCNHVFHHACLKTWLLKNILQLNCPNCKNQLIEIENSLEKTDSNIVRIIPFNPLNINRQIQNESLEAHRRNDAIQEVQLVNIQAPIISLANNSMANINTYAREIL